MDKFFTQKTCSRCHADLKGGRIMSMLNDQCICMACSDAETKRPEYKAAREADAAAFRQRNGLQEPLDRFDLETIERYRQICESAYRRTINGRDDLIGFKSRLSGDSASFYASEIKIPKIQKELNAIRDEYIAKFDK